MTWKFGFALYFILFIYGIMKLYWLCCLDLKWWGKLFCGRFMFCISLLHVRAIYSLLYFQQRYFQNSSQILQVWITWSYFIREINAFRIIHVFICLLVYLFNLFLIFYRALWICHLHQFLESSPGGGAESGQKCMWMQLTVVIVIWLT